MGTELQLMASDDVKQNINDLDSTISEVIYLLEPHTFSYIKDEQTKFILVIWLKK